MQTTCESCLFSIKDGDKQTGCKFYRLDKFEKELVDDKFYILNGYCNSCRNVNWYYKADHPDATEEELIEQCKKEMGLKYNFFITHFANDSSCDVIEMVKELEKLSVKPRYIYVLTTLDFNNAAKLYIDIMPHTSSFLKIDILHNNNADEDSLIRRGFNIACDYEYTVIINSNERPIYKLSFIDYINQKRVVDGGEKLYFVNFHDYYLVDTQFAKQLLFEDVEDKNLKLRLTSSVKGNVNAWEM